MLLETYEYLLTAWATAINATSSMGFPTWARPEMVLPCVALELTTGQAGIERIGQRQAQFMFGLRGWLFARQEPELCTLLDGLITWHRTHGAFEIAARRVACALLEFQRHVPDTNNEKEQHAVTFLVQVVW
jgi:hypothetical protein